MMAYFCKFYKQIIFLLAVILVIAIAVMWQSKKSTNIFTVIGIQSASQLHPAQIVSLAPAITHILLSLRTGPQLIGVDKNSQSFPYFKKHKVQVVSAYPQPNMEQLLVLHPDLVLVWDYGQPMDQLKILQKEHIRVITLKMQTLNDIVETIKLLGMVTGHVQLSEKVAIQFNNQLHAMALEYQHLKPVRVFFQVWHNPMITVGGGQFISEAIHLCGGVNIFGDIKKTSVIVSNEALAIRHPQLIVASGDSNHQDRLRTTLKQQWQVFSRLYHNQLYFALLDSSIEQPSDQFVVGMKQLCKVINRYRYQKKY